MLTPAADEIAALAGVLGSFADGAERVLWKMAGLRLSESTVQRTTEAAGRRVAERLGEGKSLGPTRAWPWQRDARGQRCAYISLDATGVRQQGPGGARAGNSGGGEFRGHEPILTHWERLDRFPVWLDWLESWFRACRIT